MTLEQLRALQAIVEGGSLRAAALCLHRSQPTISVAIKNLEDELGVQIFDRDQYRNKLSPQGKALYEKSKLVLEQASSLKNLANQLASGEELQVGIAFTSVIPVGPIIGAIRECKSLYPKTRLDIFSENGMGPIDRLDDKSASIIIIPWIKNIERLQSMPFMKMRMIPVISTHSALHEQYDQVPKNVIRDYPQVIISGRKASKQSYGILEGGDQWRVNDFQTKKEIILQGEGWGSLPEHMIANELEQGLLAPIQVEGFVTPPDLDIRVARLDAEPVGPVGQRLWQMFNRKSATAQTL